jgi:hypothetical protein
VEPLRKENAVLLRDYNQLHSEFLKVDGHTREDTGKQRLAISKLESAVSGLRLLNSQHAHRMRALEQENLQLKARLSGLLSKSSVVPMSQLIIEPPLPGSSEGDSTIFLNALATDSGVSAAAATAAGPDQPSWVRGAQTRALREANEQIEDLRAQLASAKVCLFMR